MPLTDADRARVAKAIKHFEALQKRYTTQHNGTACEHVGLALEGLNRPSEGPEAVRCEQCRRSTMMDFCANPQLYMCGHFGKFVVATDFCSYGERAEAGKEQG